MTARPKSQSRIYFDAALARGLEILRKEHPEIIIDGPNVLFLNVPYAWNNGRPERYSLGCSLEISLESGTASARPPKGEEIKEVFINKKDVLRLNNAPNALIIVLFGLDCSLTFSRLKTAESYRTTMHDRFALPVKDFTYLTTIDPPTS